MSNGLDDMIEEDDRRAFLQEEDKNQNLEFENQNLKKQLALLQQQMEEKERTIRLLQQQMVSSRFVTICQPRTQCDRIISKFLNSLNRPHCRCLRAPVVGLPQRPFVCRVRGLPNETLASAGHLGRPC